MKNEYDIIKVGVDNMKTLVAYFSCTGTTKKLAEDLNEVVNGTLYEIKPSQTYSDEDLNWMDKKSRSSIEMQDKSSRPEIVDDLTSVDEYDTIYIGFPIWWYQAPTIINTFLEKYNLDGKTIIPFATSGSSGMGKTNDYLIDSCPGAILKEGKRFSNPTKEELEEWVNSL